MAALSLIVAPAGYGKTTLVSTWQAQTGLPSAWFSLDKRDNDPALFVAGLAAALATIFPGFDGSVLEALNSPHSVPYAELVVQIINRLNELSRDFILVLDDYHVIHQPAIHQLLVDLVSFPPLGQHLVLTARHDPPLPWRVRTQSSLCELRVGDLSFTDEEAAQFLAKACDRPVAHADAHQLVRLSQGWITSLRLMALAMRLDSPDAPWPAMESAGARDFGEYFNHEVLADVAPELVAFLVRTSILDVLSGPLCDYVAGTETVDSQPADLLQGRSSAEFLRELVSLGIFTEAMDDDGTWYRYHPLLRDVLRRRLTHTTADEVITGLYVRACVWHEDHDLLDEALGYALASGQIEPAVTFVQRHRQALLNRWEWPRLERWLQQFSPTAVGSHVELLLARAWINQWNYNLTDVRVDLEHIETLLAKLAPDNPLVRGWQGEVAALRSQQCLVMGDGAGAAAAAIFALSSLSAGQFFVRTSAMVYLVLGYQMNGEWQEAVALSSSSRGETGAPRELVLARTLTLRAYIDLPSANLPVTHTAYATLLQLLRKSGFKTNTAWAHYFWACTCYLQNDLHGAETHFAAVVALVDNAHAQTYTHSAIGLALTYQAQGRPQEALDTIESAQKSLATRRQYHVLRFAEAFAAELAARQGRVEEALHWVRRAGGQFEYDALPMFYTPGLAFAKVLLAGSTPGNLLAAKSWLEEQTAFAQRTHNVHIQIQCHTLAAILYDLQGRRQEALEALAHALTLAERGQIVRVFADLALQLAPLFDALAAAGALPGFAARVRNAVVLECQGGTKIGPEASAADATPASRSEGSKGVKPSVPATPGLPPNRQEEAARAGSERDLRELLTYREMDVLNLLDQRLTNKEIAHALGISTETVRQHTVNLFRKLNVDNRRQAIVVARSLGYIGTPTP